MRYTKLRSRARPDASLRGLPGVPARRRGPVRGDPSAGTIAEETEKLTSWKIDRTKSNSFTSQKAGIRVTF